MNKANGGAFSEDLIRAELARVLESPIFEQSERLGRFLRFAVEHAISGSEDGLKEYIIGTEVYDRRPPYHPSQDSIVRTEARRLRIKLKEYYESEGRDNPIFIYFRPGSYIPVFRPKVAASCQEIAPGSPEEQIFVEGAGIPVAVIPFLDASGQPLSSEFARGVTDELVHELMQCEGVRVVATSSIAQSGSQAQDISSLAQRLGVRIVFEGSVRLEGARVRVTSRMVSADGFQLWSQRFDAEAVPSSFFDVQEQFASALVNRVRPTQSIIRSGEASAGPVVLSLYPSLLKAEVWLEEGNESEVQCALAKFHEIAQATKGYARPLYGAAQCYCWMTLSGAPPSAGMVSLARNASEQAVELDPESSEALASKGSVLALEWDWSGAEEAFQQAAKLGFCVSSARHQEAFEVFSEPLKHGPLPLDVQLYLALIHANLEQFDEARRLAQLILRNGGSQMPLRAGVAEILARCGDNAAPMAHEHKLLSSGAPLSRYRQALLSIALGDSEGALSLLSSAFEDKEAELPWLAVDPRFDPIRL